MRYRAVVVLLAVIAVGVIAIAAVLIVRPGGESGARKAARQDAHDQAAIYCTLQGVVPGMTGLDDPAYLNCVKRTTADNLAEWDSAQP